jgi:hypothetical protein
MNNEERSDDYRAGWNDAIDKAAYAAWRIIREDIYVRAIGMEKHIPKEIRKLKIGNEVTTD